MTLEFEKDVASIFMVLARRDRGAAEEALAIFKIEKASQLKPEQYESFVAYCKAQRPPTLRDAFAVAALQSPGISHWTYGYNDKDTPADTWAERAYEIADAMLRARVK
jgi:hypothetical protein